MSETKQEAANTAQEETSAQRGLRSRLKTRTAKRFGIALIVVAALIAGVSGLRSGAFSAVLPRTNAAAGGSASRFRPANACEGKQSV